MSTTAIFCSSCGTQNMSSSQYCGGCGVAVMGGGGSTPNVSQPIQKTEISTGSNPKEWHEMAGLICGVISLFLCGIFAAIPGLYFSWSARGIAKLQGRGTGLATTGIVLNGIGIVLTFAAIAVLILVSVLAASAGQPDPMMGEYGMPGAYGYQ